MSKTLLGVSWLNGRFEVVLSKGKRIHGHWSSPHPVRHVGEMAPLLREAVKAVGYRGADAFLVLDHRHLIYHLQEAPLGKTSAVRPFLQRKVQQGKFFESGQEVRWSYHAPIAGQGKQRFLLTLLPESVLENLAGAFADAGLLLTGVFAPGAVLGQQFSQLRLQPEESALLVADLGGALCLVAGKGDGQVLFCRHLASDSLATRARAGQEINRTLLYVQQQFGVPIQSLWIYGQEAVGWITELSIRDGIHLYPSPKDPEKHYFAHEVTHLASLASSNLISAGSIRRRHLRRFSAVGAWSLLTAALLTAWVAEKEVARRETVQARWQQTWNRLEEQRDRLLFRQQEMQLLERNLQRLDAAATPPVVNVFTRYLSSAMPGALQLTGFSMARKEGEEEGYEFRLEGFSRSEGSLLLPDLTAFEEELSQGFFQAQILDSTRDRLLRGEENAPLILSRQAGLRQDQRTFFVRGMLP